MCVIKKEESRKLKGMESSTKNPQKKQEDKSPKNPEDEKPHGWEESSGIM